MSPRIRCIAIVCFEIPRGTLRAAKRLLHLDTFWEAARTLKADRIQSQMRWVPKGHYASVQLHFL